MWGTEPHFQLFLWKKQNTWTFTPCPLVALQSQQSRNWPTVKGSAESASKLDIQVTWLWLWPGSGAGWAQ